MNSQLKALTKETDKQINKRSLSRRLLNALVWVIKWMLRPIYKLQKQATIAVLTTCLFSVALYTGWYWLDKQITDIAETRQSITTAPVIVSKTLVVETPTNDLKAQ